MAGFNDLIGRAQPSLAGGGATALGTEGADWLWTFIDVVDNDGTPIDLSGATVTCIVRDAVNLTPIITLTGVGLAGGKFTIGATAAQTANLVTGLIAARYVSTCYLTLSSKVVQVWNPENSPFTIRSN